MKVTAIAMTLAVLMCGAAVGSIAARPSSTASGKGLGVKLETTVPKSFAGWNEVPERNAQLVNPQTQELLDKLYSQILTRTYVNAEGYRIMLSMAYGDDQRGGLQAHRPEVCYPAQGFKLHAKEDGALKTAYGDIDVRRIHTSLGARSEPVTYWLTVGNQVIKTSVDKRMAEIRLMLTGQIPDGLLFRVSSIDGDTARAYEMQRKFVADMMEAVPSDARQKLSGLAAAPAS